MNADVNERPRYRRPVSFRGFPPEAFDFYERLEADNSKAFWDANKAIYQDCVKGPMEALCLELSDVGPFHIFRPYTDQRFAQGRPAYKTAQGAVTQGEGGTGYYLQVSAEGLMAGAGYYMMARDQLQRFRAAVDADATGREIAALVDDAVRSGYWVGAHDELKTAPRGYAKDHPRIALLRRSGLMAWRSWPVASWLHTRRAATKVRELWTGAAPLCRWLDAHVGPSTLPPADAPFG
jgi:uncharacterized protein (TIGR02453 family)